MGKLSLGEALGLAAAADQALHALCRLGRQWAASWAPRLSGPRPLGGGCYDPLKKALEGEGPHVWQVGTQTQVFLPGESKLFPPDHTAPSGRAT